MAGAPEAHVHQDAQELAAEAADLFLWLADQAIATRGQFAVALSGGTTPKAVYRTLASTQSKLDWTKVLFFFGDERCVPPSHEDSNFLMAQTSLFQPLGIPETRIFRMAGELDPEPASRAYEAIMRRTLGPSSGGWPRFDLVLLGLGEDGHTASLFPGTPALGEQIRWVVPGFAPVGIKHRLTVTLNVINHADVVLFLVAGAGKAQIARKVLEPSSSEAAPYPASLVHPTAGRYLWFLDKAAASDLTVTKQHLSSREE
ncbi:MAG TPA: 6-phosphogluconolactonase [Nitrospiraceae bacterium]|nr:6-phosphogluconolactonase [Nitrospiraceae bacterium]